jgi:uncharacterized cupredoxin-like copper-binding protein
VCALAILVPAGCAQATASMGPGMMGGRAVGGTTSACRVPAHLAGQTVSVMEGDTRMSSMMGRPSTVLPGGVMLRAVPPAVTARTVTFVARNMGRKTHELVMLPLAAGSSAGQRVPGADGKVDESGSLGEASNPCGAGAGDGITAGSVSWVTVTLAPGRYELICNLPNHYAGGMYQEFHVA